MGLEKAIAHGKEHRKPYHDSRAIAGECRNHGGCPYPPIDCIVLKNKNNQLFKS